jgi:Uncharacterized conserved protein
MAKIVYGAGISHSPLLILNPSDWELRSQDDYINPSLNTSDGRWLSYQELEAEAGTAHEKQARCEVYVEKHSAAQKALDRIAADLAASAPDVVLIVGDDQRENFGEDNQPALAVFYGDKVTMSAEHFGHEDAPVWARNVAVGYAMDQAHCFPGSPALGVDVIQGLMERHFDVTAMGNPVEPCKRGFGHAFGFVIRRLLGDRSVPILPILLNTYYPPNVPSAARCFGLGQALRESIEASKCALRVAVIASGGLSHFIVDEALDREVLRAISEGDSEALVSIPREALNSGSSEILNWITVAAALEGHQPSWSEYYPVYRTPAGTGVGVAFASWKLGI